MVVNPEAVDFPSRNLSCYEAVLITTLKYMGLSEETPLMGTQAYFVLVEDEFDVSPRFNGIVDEWKRIHHLELEMAVASNEDDLRDQIRAHLEHDRPVSVPVDMYVLPFTPNYEHQHLGHFVSIFGWKQGSYYVVCPYYRFKGWLGDQLVHRGHFADIVGPLQKYLTIVTSFQLGDLSPERCRNLVWENCQNMAGLSTPAALAGVHPTRRGLEGIRTFSTFLRDLIPRYGNLSQVHLLDMSRKVLEIGYSRYWFCRFIQTFCPQLGAGTISLTDLESRFKNAADLWRAAGMKIAASVYASRPEEMVYAAQKLEKVYTQEEYLCSVLRESLSGHEAGTL